MSSIHLLMNKHPFNLRCSRQLHKIVKVNISLMPPYLFVAILLITLDLFRHVELACQDFGVGLPPPYPQKKILHAQSVCLCFGDFFYHRRRELYSHVFISVETWLQTKFDHILY